jgi:hypothetical protein
MPIMPGKARVSHMSSGREAFLDLAGKGEGPFRG